MDADRLFVETLNDLDGRVRSSQQPPSEYYVLKAAGLLRLLLLDAQPLIDQVNRTRKLKIRYRVSDRAPMTNPMPILWTIQDGLDPDTSLLPSSVLELDRDKFLKRVVIAYLSDTGRQKTISIQDLILHLAHNAGGVHAGQPKTELEQKLSEWDQLAAVGGYPPAVRSLFAVGRVVLKGLAPLKAVVEQDLSGTTR